MSRTPSATARAVAARKARLAVAAGLAFGMVASGALVWRGTEAAFTRSTTSTASWATGSVAISDDDGGTVGGAMFAATGLTSGSSAYRCIAVTYSGTNAAQVRLYATAVTGDGLAPYVTLTIEEGTGGSSADCTGFTRTSELFTGPLTTFQSARTQHENGLSTWNPPGGATSQVRTYKITYALAADAPQARSAGLTFTWEARG